MLLGVPKAGGIFIGCQGRPPMIQRGALDFDSLLHITRQLISCHLDAARKRGILRHGARRALLVESLSVRERERERERLDLQLDLGQEISRSLQQVLVTSSTRPVLLVTSN